MDDTDKHHIDGAPAKAANKGGKAAGTGHEPGARPQWADSLRTMYDKVVDEPIPDSFKDLLAKLDEPAKRGDGT